MTMAPDLNVKSIFYMTSELTPLLAKDATNLGKTVSCTIVEVKLKWSAKHINWFTWSMIGLTIHRSRKGDGDRISTGIQQPQRLWRSRSLVMWVYLWCIAPLPKDVFYSLIWRSTSLDSSSKAAAVSLSTNLAVTLGPKLITVNAICPVSFSHLNSYSLHQMKAGLPPGLGLKQLNWEGVDGCYN